MPSNDPPSLTYALLSVPPTSSPSTTLRKRWYKSILSTLGINLFLPFLNGVMLGCGEIFAREFLGVYFDYGPAARSLRPKANTLGATATRIPVREGGLGREAVRTAGEMAVGGAEKAVVASVE
ncbi:hypothetical protein BT69DRAFT_1335190 [Atractiella rhizophila]|nr:hypothetical protein BT69DRAFT_1335190 [Atractiella rhizophila]